MSAQAVETYETRTPDSEGWRGIPFRHPRDMAVAHGGEDDGGHGSDNTDIEDGDGGGGSGSPGHLH
ncbi:hypothetical protein [Streptomyces noursei]|uniref:hypothetical protein n=1 Tax=Streptomyces noursei TaxID=1971 RepID=UPI00167799D7|nr:hypothetical protein [Streptomyces noursei]MCZ1017720.1 hypothetical protein [Streptomyces noursei]GGX56660.1 hypothetical protein GCM10010341_91390 [Streptomyces noursei]